MNATSILIGLALAIAGAGAEPPGELPPETKTPDRPCWHRAPTLSVMTGFIYQPLSPYTIHDWMENLGSDFDADHWVRDFKEVGASHVVFYDKWIDGLVFHDTKTTTFKTKRDFLREFAAACQRGGLPLVLYFNAISDGNPEFDPWSLLDKRGDPIVFSPNWPTRYQTLHSPFRQKCVEQVQEFLSDYGPIHGIWFDIFHERFNTSSPWTARGYEQMFGEPFQQATGARLEEFQVRTLAGYLDEIDAIRRQQRQDQCVFTANGSGSAFLGGGAWAEHVGSRLQYLFNEGHSFEKNEELARLARALPKPLDINLLLNRSWFTPLEDTPPPASLTVEQAIAATAIAVCQGAGVNFALTPGHDGEFGEDLQRAKAVGAWFREIHPWLVDAEPVVDVGILHGPHASSVSKSLARAGVFSRWIASDRPLPACRAIIVPPGSRMDQRLCDYVRDGGTLIAFGQAPSSAEIFGVDFRGEVRFAGPLQGATVKADSEYDAQFAAAHLLDDDPGTAWASGGTPMPHWAEITLPEPVEVRTVELVTRQGAYLVTDVDIELPEADGWRVAHSVRDAKDRKIVIQLDSPATTDRIRVRILRELYEGRDRQYADVASIRVLDHSGNNLARSVRALVRVSGEVQGEFPPRAVAVMPTTAEVLARFEQADNAPAILRNKFGQGQALLVTCSTVPEDAAFWSSLRSLMLGEPSFIVDTNGSERVRLMLTRVGDHRVLHVIDSAVPAENYQPASVEISLAARQLGALSKARLAGSDQTVPVETAEGRIRFLVRPDPVATIVFATAG